MFRFLFKKQQQVESLIEEYLGSVETARRNFLRAIDTYLETGRPSPTFEFLTQETHKAESRGDDIVEGIGRLLFEKALIPEFRADLVTLLDCIDNVPGQFDRVLYSIQNQRVSMPEEIRGEYRNLADVSVRVCSLMLESVRSLFERQEGIAELHREADQLESEGDHIEHRIISHIFDSSWDPLQKLLLRDLTSLMGDIADHAINACRRVHLITIKRRV